MPNYRDKIWGWGQDHDILVEEHTRRLLHKQGTVGQAERRWKHILDLEYKIEDAEIYLAEINQ